MLCGSSKTTVKGRFMTEAPPCLYMSLLCLKNGVSHTGGAGLTQTEGGGVSHTAKVVQETPISGKCFCVVRFLLFLSFIQYSFGNFLCFMLYCLLFYTIFVLSMLYPTN